MHLTPSPLDLNDAVEQLMMQLKKQPVAHETLQEHCETLQEHCNRAKNLYFPKICYVHPQPQHYETLRSLQCFLKHKMLIKSTLHHTECSHHSISHLVPSPLAHLPAQFSKKWHQTIMIIIRK